MANVDPPMMESGMFIPEGWRLLYSNPLQSSQDTAGFRDGRGRGRDFSPWTAAPGEQAECGGRAKANLVYWCPEEFPADMAVSWRFRPLREPGLAILFFSARGSEGRDLFDPALPPRTGEYDQYHHGAMDAFHVSYFRRMWAEERSFHTCNLRKSYGFHLVAQGADPLPGVADAADSYRMLIVKKGPSITFAINELIVFSWLDDGLSYGPLLAGGKSASARWPR
ncbi:hypothetical protein HMSSN036_38790 [Paenibacillus macerans]|nr:hypothetical protein HMSSN036_38790 [Paenibacillus macerans]